MLYPSVRGHPLLGGLALIYYYYIFTLAVIDDQYLNPLFQHELQNSDILILSPNAIITFAFISGNTSTK